MSKQANRDAQFQLICRALLYEHPRYGDAELDTQDIARLLGVSPQTALKIMREAAAQGCVILKDAYAMGGGHGTRAASVRLSRQTLAGLLGLHMMCSEEYRPRSIVDAKIAVTIDMCHRKIAKESAELAADPKKIGLQNTIDSARAWIQTLQRDDRLAQMASEVLE